MGDDSTNGNGRVRHSLFERIAWTYDIDPIGRSVLQALATFGNYKTGRNARPSLATLAERCRMDRRNLRRYLERLEDAGYITGQTRVRKPTVYNLCVEKLSIDMQGTVAGRGKSTPSDDTVEDDDSIDDHGLIGVDLPPSNSDPRGRFTPTLGVDLPPANAVSEGKFTPTLGVNLPPDPPTYRSSSTERSSNKSDPPISTSGLRPDAPDDPETTTAPLRGVWAAVGQVRHTGAVRTIHERRTRLVAKVLREEVIPTRASWPDHHTVKVELRTALKRLEILADVDYGQAHFDDAISIVNAATPFIGRVH